MHRLTENERGNFELWLDNLAKGDTRLRALLAATLGRIAAGTIRRILKERGRGSTMKMGDFLEAKGWPEDNESIVLWIRGAMERDAEWLSDVDENGIPKLLSGCHTTQDLLDAAAADLGVHWLNLPR